MVSTPVLGLIIVRMVPDVGPGSTAASEVGPALERRSAVLPTMTAEPTTHAGTENSVPLAGSQSRRQRTGQIAPFDRRLYRLARYLESRQGVASRADIALACEWTIGRVDECLEQMRQQNLVQVVDDESDVVLLTERGENLARGGCP